MILPLYKWNSEWLRRKEFPNKMGLPGWAKSRDCCCVNYNCPCGRTYPGRGGSNPMPFKLCAMVEFLSPCRCPNHKIFTELTLTPSEGDVWKQDTAIDLGVWYNPFSLQWENCGSIRSIELLCDPNDGKWVNGIFHPQWVIGFNMHTACGDWTFEVFPDSCDPFLIDAFTMNMVGAGCCGTRPVSLPPYEPMDVNITIWEGTGCTSSSGP